MKVLFFILSLFWSFSAWASQSKEGDYLIQVTPELKAAPLQLLSAIPGGTKMEDLGVNNWIHIKVPQQQAKRFSLLALQQNPNVLRIQPNYKISLLNDYQIHGSLLRYQLAHQTRKIFGNDFLPFPSDGDDDDGGFPWPFPIDGGDGDGGFSTPEDNPPISPPKMDENSGADPLQNRQWAMKSIGVEEDLNTPNTSRQSEVVVAVIDTGVNYKHKDLVNNLWRNPGETGLDSQGRDKSTNGVDDDNNGYTDDWIGWDFTTTTSDGEPGDERGDSRPFDLYGSVLEVIFGGGHAGHGTHVAGCVGARTNNAKGIRGISSSNMIKLMAVRFLNKSGQGDTAGAIKAIRYAIENGAQVLNNSWGSEGEDPNNADGNQALRDGITDAQRKGVLFVAAAGNGHQGKGYNNDTDDRPAYPASYPHPNIISVAAIDKEDKLGSFSNWGTESVDLAAPGVEIYSTTANGNYNNMVIDLEALGIQAAWSGTSMAAPFVSSVLAHFISQNPDKNWHEAKDALLNNVQPVDSLKGKVHTGGKLNSRGWIQN